MVSLPIYNRSGQEVGKYDIDPAAIAPNINKQLLHDVVVMYQANMRQGTFRSKSRAEVAGSTKKMYRQKGTGNARAGSRRSPVRRGGGHTFAKRPRDFSYRLPRKALQLATRMALASKIQTEQVVVIDDLKLTEPKTKEMHGILKALKCDRKTLTGKSRKTKGVTVVTAAYDKTVYMSARNIEAVEVSPVGDLNALIILKPKRLLMTRAALDMVQQRGKA